MVNFSLCVSVLLCCIIPIYFAAAGKSLSSLVNIFSAMWLQCHHCRVIVM